MHIALPMTSWIRVRYMHAGYQKASETVTKLFIWDSPDAFYMLCQSGEQFLQCSVPGDEAWINHMTPKTEKASKTGNIHHLPHEINLKQCSQLDHSISSWTTEECFLWISLTMVTSNVTMVQFRGYSWPCTAKHLPCCTVMLHDNTQPHTVNQTCDCL
jgi:hypothetical protein